MIHKWLPYLFLLFTLAFVDQRTLDRVNLQVARFELFLRSLPLRIKLEWEIFLIRRNKAKYLKMAEQILKDLESNETDKV